MQVISTTNAVFSNASGDTSHYRPEFSNEDSPSDLSMGYNTDDKRQDDHSLSSEDDNSENS